MAPPHYVYEAWIGCGAEGFARSVDGGAHFSAPITLPDSSQSDDSAVAVAPDGTLYVSYLRYFNNYAYPVVATSFDHGATFSQSSSLIPQVVGNWETGTSSPPDGVARCTSPGITGRASRT